MNIENFKGSFDNVARPNLFEVSGFGLPADIKFKVKAATIPSENITAIEVPYQSRRVKVAGDRTYEAWPFTVMQTTDFNVYEALSAWMATINAPVDNVGVNPAGYKRDGIIDQLDVDGSVIKTVQLIGAWPAIIGAVELDWENQNSVETFPVTFEYDYHL